MCVRLQCWVLSAMASSSASGVNLPTAHSYSHGHSVLFISRKKLPDDGYGQGHSALFSTRKKMPALTVCSSAVQRSNSELNQGIAHFYDDSSTVWEDIWGEHMHHGFYDPGLPFIAALFTDHTAAQIRMIEETLAWAGIPDQGNSKPQRIVDVGCGIGGSSRYLAQKYGADVMGITLSPKQAQRATELTSSAGMLDKVSFQVADALNQPFPDEHFDLVWSMESGEHMPDKQKFLSELARVTKPGGQIIIVTWCHRELLSNEKTLKSSEQELLDKLCEIYYLPAWCATSKYVEVAQSMGLQDVKADDWSERVTPFWPAVIVSALSLRGLFGLAKSGRTTIQGAIAMAYMVQGYNTGLIKFALITARKQG